MRTFFTQGDYHLYRHLLAEESARGEIAVAAFCLMPNHVQLIVVPAAPGSLSVALRRLHRRYAEIVNARSGWKGHLWQERFASFPMDPPHTRNAVRYVLQNPVRAGLVTRPAEWPWSSARAHLREGSVPFLASDEIDRLVGDWSQLLASAIDDAALAELRTASRSGRPLAAPELIERLERQLGRRLTPRRSGRRRREPCPHCAAS
jgi:putative transposase